MCGICGIVDVRGERVSEDALRGMNATLFHRGPDSEGVLVDGPVGLAMRRLSIIDLDGGSQPIGNETGSIQVVQNGEIYNYRELRAELERAGHRFATHSDTEVLVHLYEEHGLGFAERLRGMFAVAIWDSERRRVVVARDRFGIKPLYWRHAGGQVSFASELKALREQPGFSRELDPDALEAYLALNWVPAPLTIYREARKLPPGHLLVVEDGEPRVERYARPAPAPRSALRQESFEELAEELRGRLRDSVRAHLIADVPVGVLLSGGVDSSAIAALAADQVTGRLQTFSIGFDEAGFNELDRARLTAQRYDTDHHELVVRPDAVDLLPKVVGAYDEPFADSSALPTYLVNELAAKHVKVALAGEGGDELFAGYNTYAADRIAGRLGPLAARLRPLIDLLPSSSGAARLDDKAKRFAAAGALPPLERHCGWTQVLSPEVRRELLDGRGGSLDPIDLYRARFAETAGAELLTRLQDVDLGINLADDQLVKTDRASMAHSLEARVPFLDPAVSDFAFSTPAVHKVRGLQKKRLLRAAVAPVIPAEILTAPKQGFSIPAAAWLRGELSGMVREQLSPARLREQGWFQPEPVARLIDEHLSARADRSRQLWSLLVFTLWNEQ
ncbi:MAG: asparagine synthase (glutamine-hydrolyzing) [Actinomycetota bacterium]|nr:asparagine synthase (glutamine-hydrolyzing) [Actinomycetota bacterium]